MEEVFYETWCDIPRDYWGECVWLHEDGALKSGIPHDPVARLRRSLYGHPLSGKFWVNFYDNILVNCCGLERHSHVSAFSPTGR